MLGELVEDVGRIYAYETRSISLQKKRVYF
jgi:hypothetical protein